MTEIDNPQKEGEIYIITCDITGKQYVGQTQKHRTVGGRLKTFGYMGRFKEHIYEALSGTKLAECCGLNNAIRKYGEQVFTCELLHECHPEELDDMEIQYIAEYDTFRNGYNLNKGGFGGKLDPKVYEHISQTNINKTDTQREYEFAEISVTEDIISVHLTDLYAYNTCMIVLEIRTTDNSYKYHYGGNRTEYHKMFERAYEMIIQYIDSDSIFVSHRVQHNLAEHVNGYDFNCDDIKQIVHKKPELNRNFAGLHKRIARYQHYTIHKVTIKRRQKKGHDVIGVCMKTAEKDREVVAQFGGDNLMFKDAYEIAMEFATELVDNDIITVTQEVQNLIKMLN